MQVSQPKARLKLVLLMAMFILPPIAAWYLVFFTNYGRDEQGVEHGVLVTPPRQLADVPLIRAAESVPQGATLYGKWSILFFVDGSCDEIFEQMLYRSRQIRLATGRHISRVQRIAIVESDAVALSGNCFADSYPSQLYVLAHYLPDSFLGVFEDQNIDEQGTIFIVDPRGFLMMRYAVDTEPVGIIRDLLKLLRVSYNQYQ